jgi:sugar phosphate isomerase/epimerase
LQNVERLAARVEDVELLFFEAALPTQLPAADELTALAKQREAHGLSYSVHTPLDASLASADEALRAASVQSVLRVIALTRPLSPSNYVLHIYLGDREHDATPPTTPAQLAAWRARAACSLREISAACGVDPACLCVESIDYDFGLIADLVAEHGLSFALDIGHLHRDGGDLAAFLERYLARTRIVQWHGTDDTGRDHVSLAHYPQTHALQLLRTLIERGYAGVLTLEVFREADFETSLALVQGWLKELRA